MRKLIRGWSFAVALAVASGCQCSVSPHYEAPDAGADAGLDGESDAGALCDNLSLATGCVFGRCALSTASRPLPGDGVARVIEEPIPAALDGDIISASLCTVVLPPGVQTTDLTLSITLDVPAPADATLISYDATVQASRALPSHPLDVRVTGLITGSGSFGVTRGPADWQVSGYLGVPVLGSATPSEFLRNLGAAAFSAAFYDGQRLYVGNGSRLLIYDGLPRSPVERPSVILGQVDLDDDSANLTGSLFGTAGVNSVWSDGTRLVVGNGNRVLVWRTIPTNNLTPADLVLGQPDFNTNTSNTGGVTASSFGSIAAIDSDGTRLVVADALNHRVLGWRSFPIAVSQPADLVIGQPDFLSNGAYGGAMPLYLPNGVALHATGLYTAGLGGPGLAHARTLIDNPPSDFAVFGWQFNGIEPGSQVNRPAGVVATPNGGVAVRDISLRRVLVTRAASTGPATADFVLGQPDESRTVGWNWVGGSSSTNPSRITGSSLGDTRGLGRGAGTLLVPDERRLLLYDTFPTYNFEPATRVLGQAGSSINEIADYRTISGATMANPTDVAVNGTTMAVADRGNNRVLLFGTAGLTDLAPPAHTIIGQPNSTSYLANGGGLAASASVLSGPTGVALDGTHLVVADTENHRVLIWNSVPDGDGAPADVVLGQADFTGRRPNRGRGDVAPLDGFSDVGADGLFYPSGVASDGTHLFVTDRLNHRVLVWDTFPNQNDQPATRVLGQPTMTTIGAHGGTGAFTVTESGLNLPTAIVLSGSTLWVADTENNRVVRYENVFTTPSPTAFVGQTTGTSVGNPNYRLGNTVFAGNPEIPPTTASSVLRPRGLAVAQGRLFVSEIDSNRVHVFDATTLAPLAVLGQRTATGAAPNLGGIAATSMAEPMGLATDGQNLWVADSRNHRVLGYPVTGTAPTLLVGQPSFLAVGFNGTSTAADGATAAPHGLAIDGDTLFVADTNNNRVIAFKTSGAVSPTQIFGQPNDTLALPNAGGTVSARSLNGPRGAAVASEKLATADTKNNRLLVFDLTSSVADATAVLGQTSMSDSSANRGAAPTLGSLAAPGGVCSDGTSLFVVDTGNHRVLGWRTLPMANGQDADTVLGQADGASVLGNRGGQPTGATLSLPAACAMIGGKLFVADTGNNRVLRFDTPFAANGAAADGLLGQPQLTSRIPSATVEDKALLAGPVAIATDGTNLYVADRDLARIVEYGPGFESSNESAIRVLSSIGDPRVQQVFGGLVARRESLFTTRLFISDSNASRIAVVSLVTRLQP